MSNWRSVFEKRSEPNKKHSPAAKTAQKVFVVLEDSVSGLDDKIKFRFYVAEPNATGALLKIEPLTIEKAGSPQWGDASTQAVSRLISALAREEIFNRYGHNYFSDAYSLIVSAKALRPILNGLLETEIIYSSTDDFTDDYAHALKDKKSCLRPAHFGALQLKVVESDSGYSLGGSVDSNANPSEVAAVPVAQLNKLVKPNLFRWNQALGFVDFSESEQVWVDELSGGDLVVPKEDAEAFVEAVLDQPLKIDLPPSLQWDSVAIKPTAQLDLKLDKRVQSARYLVDLKFQYGPRLISMDTPASVLACSEEKKLYTRHRAEEDRIFALLPQDMLVWLKTLNENGLPILNAPNLFAFVKIALEAKISVLIQNHKLQESRDFKMNVTSGLDWFDVDGQADFNGRFVKFPALLEAIRKGEMFVPLGDGSVGMLSEAMTARLEKLAAFAESNKDGLKFSKTQGLILNSLLENEQNVKVDAAFNRLREKIRNFSGVRSAEPVDSFRGTLRKYQKEGLGWLDFLNNFGLGGILADDMGLGKTIQCLAFLEARRRSGKHSRSQRSPSLLLAPKSLLSNWHLEAKKFTPDLKVLVHAGIDRNTSHDVFKKQDLIVVTYQTMLRDLDALKEIHWDCVILDEAQAIKNPEALISKASKLLPAKFRLAMTGTPVENSINDLFSISDFVNPGFLRGKKRTSDLKLNDEARLSLSKAFKPVILRRTKAQVLKDLPQKTEQLISVELETKQLKAYNELKRFYQSQLLKQVKSKGIKKSQIQILSALTRLRQAALHTGLIDASQSSAKSAKFEVLLEMLSGVIADGHRVLIFSQFTALLALLKKELDRKKIKFCYLDGQTNKRQQVVASFKSTDCPVFLMSLKAGGVGLNLVEADYVFLLDPWWNPAVEAQAIDRVHRIGQKRAVNAYRFIAKNTVEEKILELQNTKKAILADVLGQKSNLIRNLTIQDIENLLN